MFVIAVLTKQHPFEFDVQSIRMKAGVRVNHRSFPGGGTAVTLPGGTLGLIQANTVHKHSLETG